ncbi:hypothetical protein WR25_27093 [Diploscapter pachys]|uniref:Uncharacterized protein n=1 Tax=Diploscapter pachys TaxID=2018661 RepID=A0A2A2M4A8_9BILA|nr:hypothetical protein WR25_27093 [Diploscapter pachys]
MFIEVFLLSAFCQFHGGVVEQFADQLGQLLAAHRRRPVLAAVQADVVFEAQLFLGPGQLDAVAVNDHQVAGHVEAVDVDRAVEPDPESQGQQGAGEVRRVRGAMALERSHVELEQHVLFVQARGVFGDGLEVAGALHVLAELRSQGAADGLAGGVVNAGGVDLHIGDLGAAWAGDGGGVGRRAHRADDVVGDAAAHRQQGNDGAGLEQFLQVMSSLIGVEPDQGLRPRGRQL